MGGGMLQGCMAARNSATSVSSFVWSVRRALVEGTDVTAPNSRSPKRAYGPRPPQAPASKKDPRSSMACAAGALAFLAFDAVIGKTASAPYALLGFERHHAA